MTFSERQKWQKCTDMRGHGRKKYFSPKFNRFLPLNWKIWKKSKFEKSQNFSKTQNFEPKFNTGHGLTTKQYVFRCFWSSFTIFSYHVIFSTFSQVASDARQKGKKVHLRVSHLWVLWRERKWRNKSKESVDGFFAKLPDFFWWLRPVTLSMKTAVFFFWFSEIFFREFLE